MNNTDSFDTTLDFSQQLTLGVGSIFALIGLAVFLFNLLIAAIFLKKDKKSPSDRLIIIGLIGDSTYGLLMFTFPFGYAFIEVYMRLKKINHCGNYARLFYTNLDCILVMYSLFIIFFMTLNRYFAIVKPVKYKRYFSRKNVMSIAVFVICTCVILFAVGTVILLIAIIREDYCLEEDTEILPTISKIIRYVPFVWPPLQFALVVIDSSLMIFVYTSIARVYKLRCLRICCLKKHQSVIELTDYSSRKESRTHSSCSQKGLLSISSEMKSTFVVSINFNFYRFLLQSLAIRSLSKFGEIDCEQTIMKKTLKLF